MIVGDAGVDPLSQNDWIAVSISQTPVPASNPVTLTVANGRVSGRSGCNQYSGAVDYDAHHIKVGQMISTKMACLAEGLMQLEGRYLAVLQSAQDYAFSDDGRLVISGGAGKIEFAPSPRQNRP
jgi:heat shock protein HslJ